MLGCSSNTLIPLSSMTHPLEGHLRPSLDLVVALASSYCVFFFSLRKPLTEPYSFMTALSEKLFP